MTLPQIRIDFDHCGIGTALLRERFKVPPNQREYAWEEQHVTALFQDLSGAINAQKPSYFLGTVVLTPGRPLWEVADGQQRLATTTIFLAAIRDYLQDRNDVRGVQDLTRFLWTPIRAARDIEPNLQLNSADNTFFRNRILLEKGHPDRRSARTQRASHERIEVAARLAEEFVQKIISPHSDANKIPALNLWVDFIEQRALIIMLKVPDDLNAYVMFETLNDRGLRTSQSDLVKNYLFGQSDDRLPEAQDKWAGMNGALVTIQDDDEIVITYLRHLTIAKYGHIREREVLETVKRNVAGRGQALNFLEALALAAEDYVAMLSPNHERWNSYNPIIRQYIQTMDLVGIIPLRPLMLSVVRKFSQRHVEAAFHCFLCWSVRLLVAGGARSGRTEENLARVASEVEAGHINTPEAMTEALSNVIPGDVDFQNGFANARVHNNALARYYLRSLELSRRQEPNPAAIRTEDFVYNLEHVLPENPGDEWGWSDRTAATAYKKRLGNMVLLRADRNNQIGNSPFEQKRAAFRGSSFVLTQMVGGATQWFQADIEARQRKLAIIAVATWPI